MKSEDESERYSNNSALAWYIIYIYFLIFSLHALVFASLMGLDSSLTVACVRLEPFHSYLPT